jgi:hypothetical protein
LAAIPEAILGPASDVVQAGSGIIQTPTAMELVLADLVDKVARLVRVARLDSAVAAEAVVEGLVAADSEAVEEVAVLGAVDQVATTGRKRAGGAERTPD